VCPLKHFHFLKERQIEGPWTLKQGHEKNELTAPKIISNSNHRSPRVLCRNKAVPPQSHSQEDSLIALAQSAQAFSGGEMSELIRLYEFYSISQYSETINIPLFVPGKSNRTKLVFTGTFYFYRMPRCW
jgi:hypothetical protein